MSLYSWARPSPCWLEPYSRIDGIENRHNRQICPPPRSHSPALARRRSNERYSNARQRIIRRSDFREAAASSPSWDEQAVALSFIIYLCQSRCWRTEDYEALDLRNDCRVYRHPDFYRRSAAAL